MPSSSNRSGEIEFASAQEERDPPALYRQCAAGRGGGGRALRALEGPARRARAGDQVRSSAMAAPSRYGSPRPTPASPRPQPGCKPKPDQPVEDRAVNAVAHMPVLLEPVTRGALAPLEGATVVDATFGAGGYTRALLAAGAAHVLAIDRDPGDRARAARWRPRRAGGSPWSRRISPARGGGRGPCAGPPGRGGASISGSRSMQLDRAERGFSFRAEGPLDMRMGDAGTTAADIVNAAEEAALADILHFYGEERAARRIARAIVGRARGGADRDDGALAEIVASAACRPAPRPGASRDPQLPGAADRGERRARPARRGAERRRAGAGPGGRLAVVTFHSLEDRIVKRFLPDRLRPGGRHLAPRAARRGRARAALGAPDAPARARRGGDRRQSARPLGPPAGRAAHRRAGRGARGRAARPAAPAGEIGRGTPKGRGRDEPHRLRALDGGDRGDRRLGLFRELPHRRGAGPAWRPSRPRSRGRSSASRCWPSSGRISTGPHRLRALVEAHNAELALMPLATDHFGKADDAPGGRP